MMHGPINVKEKVGHVYSMKTFGGAEVYLHSFLTFALDGVGGLLNALAALSRAKGPWHSLCRNLGGGQSSLGC